MKCEKLIQNLPRYKKNRVLNRAKAYQKAAQEFLNAETRYLKSLAPLAREHKKSVVSIAEAAILMTVK